MWPLAQQLGCISAHASVNHCSQQHLSSDSPCTIAMGKLLGCQLCSGGHDDFMTQVLQFANRVFSLRKGKGKKGGKEGRDS